MAELSLPPAHVRARNVLGAAARVAGAVVHHRQLFATRDECDQRVAVCRACPSSFYRHSDRSCAACGCFIFAKARLATESCPEGHWGVNTPELLPVVVTGEDLLEKEMEIRDIFPPDSRLVQAFNAFHQATTVKSCHGCARGHNARKLEGALGHDILYGGHRKLLPAIQALYPGSTSINAPTPKRWVDLIENKA